MDLKILDVGTTWIKIQWNLLNANAPISHHILRLEESDYQTQMPNGVKLDYRVENLQYGDEPGKIQRNVRDLGEGQIFYISVLTFYKHGTFIQTEVIPTSTKTNPPGRLMFSDNTDASFRVKWSHPPKTSSKSVNPRGYHVKWKHFGTDFDELKWEDSSCLVDKIS